MVPGWGNAIELWLVLGKNSVLVGELQGRLGNWGELSIFECKEIIQNTVCLYAGSY